MPVEKRNFTVTEIKAGIFVLAAALTLVGFVVVIRGCGLGGEEVNRFTASFASINGLDLGAEVRFGGVKVGKVTEIEPDPEDRSQILVGFQVATRRRRIAVGRPLQRSGTLRQVSSSVEDARRSVRPAPGQAA